MNNKARRTDKRPSLKASSGTGLYPWVLRGYADYSGRINYVQERTPLMKRFVEALHASWELRFSYLIIN
jgi:hypothetical protein